MGKPKSSRMAYIVITISFLILLVTGFTTRVTRRMPPVEQKLFSLQAHLIKTPIDWGFVSLNV